VLLMLRPSRRGGPVPTAPMVAAAAARPAVFALLAGLPWTRLVSMAWPLLPERLRRQMNPATATSLLSVGMPLLGSLFAPRPKCRPDADKGARPG
jgi:hypothetical protein